QRTNLSKYTTRDSPLELLCYYLETGELPWWSSDNDWQLEQHLRVLLKDEPEKTVIALRRSSSAVLIKRLVLQLNLQTRLSLLDVIQPVNAIAIRLFIEQWFELINQVNKHVVSGLSKIDSEALNRLQQVINKQHSYADAFWSDLFELLFSEGIQLEAPGINKFVVTKLSEKSVINYSEVVSLILGISCCHSGNVNELEQWLEQETDNIHTNETLPFIKASESDGSERVMKGQSGVETVTDLLDNKQLIIEKKSANEIIREKFLERLTTTKSLTGSLDIKTDTKQHEADFNINTRYINNVGIILFWPFLKQLFTELKLIKKNKFCNTEDQQTAVLLLQYMATGQSEFREHQLILNKILCGWPLQQPLRNELDLQPDQEAAMNDLLQSMITHWSALKSTSIDGLRTAFINREGMLKPQHNGWLLQIERKGYDVLIDKLPWGIGLIKLPWMNKPVYTEW
ncbi:MAG: hypothetical protein KAI17_17175, partial [Thiotrichaceae bacterium]|nr:hypothetical protein [Thiotrichaceae bacterium]